MEILIDSIIGVGQNIIVFLFIPFIWWVIKYRKTENFFKFVGLNRPRLKSAIWSIALFAVIYVVIFEVDILQFFVDDISFQAMADNSESMQDSHLKGMGFLALLPAFFTNFIANGFCEEVLFRGFILQRLKRITGVGGAIILQGVLFGVMHNLLYLFAGIPVTPLFHIGMLIATSIPGILCGILNEKVFDENSIVPSILLHGFNNYIGSIRMAFML
jgi:CAAX amino terminal protease family.